MADNFYTDKTTQDLINDRIASQIDLETDPDKAIAKGQLKTTDPVAFNYGKDPMNQAVLNRAKSKLYDPDQFQELQKLQYVKSASNRLAAANLPLKGLTEVNRQMEALRKQREAAKDAQRAQVIGAVLGTAGAVVGGIYGGGAGAAGGYAAGNAVGQSAAGGGGQTAGSGAGGSSYMANE